MKRKKGIQLVACLLGLCCLWMSSSQAADVVIQDGKIIGIDDLQVGEDSYDVALSFDTPLSLWGSPIISAPFYGDSSRAWTAGDAMADVLNAMDTTPSTVGAQSQTYYLIAYDQPLSDPDPVEAWQWTFGDSVPGEWSIYTGRAVDAESTCAEMGSRLNYQLLTCLSDPVSLGHGTTFTY